MIKVLRVDDRLLHGQVAVAWTNYYKVDTVVIANDKVIVSYRITCNNGNQRTLINP